MAYQRLNEQRDSCELLGVNWFIAGQNLINISVGGNFFFLFLTILRIRGF
jgi:hypothetical protein